MREFPYGAVRTMLITLGVAAFTFLFAREASIDAPSRGEGLVLAGLCVQLALFALQMLTRRRMSDPHSRRQALLILELAGDGATVFLFAAGVFRGIGAAMHAL